MDLRWQVAGHGQEGMLEACTALSYVAAATDEVRRHTPVTAVTYRPAGGVNRPDR